ncbi:zinc ribbon domain-containing protein, partial [Micromonospora zhanjiangensis]
QNRVTQAEFRCVACGHTAHADVNAASNILRAGLARQAAPAA